MKIGVRQARDGPRGIKSVVIDEKRRRRHESSGKRAGKRTKRKSNQLYEFEHVPSLFKCNKTKIKKNSEVVG